MILTDREREEMYAMEKGIKLEPVQYDLSDPVVRLGVIVALRDLGYTVEPA